MKVVLGCDVDPVLPPVLRARPDGDVWECLQHVDALVGAAGSELPPITWLIRADESVRVATTEFASGYLAKADLWDALRARGHELGWHMHLWSFSSRHDCFRFDSSPAWLDDAHGRLAQHIDIRATRTGWDYGSSWLVRQLDRLHVRVDFSALPGQIAWQRVGAEEIVSDWLRTPAQPYHPSDDDYQRPGNLALLEVPVTSMRNSVRGIAVRAAWRLWHGRVSRRGLSAKTRMLTQAWDALPEDDSPVWAFYFHPEDLQGDGLSHFLRNVERLRTVDGVEFVTASTLTSLA